MSTSKVQPLLKPVLRTFADGLEHGVDEIRERAADELRLGDKERTEFHPKSRQKVHTNLVAFALLNFMMGKAITKKRKGWYQITERGTKLLARAGSDITIGEARTA